MVVIWHLALIGLLVLRPRHVFEGLLGVLAARLGVSSFGEHGEAMMLVRDWKVNLLLTITLACYLSKINSAPGNN